MRDVIADGVSCSRVAKINRPIGVTVFEDVGACLTFDMLAETYKTRKVVTAAGTGPPACGHVLAAWASGARQAAERVIRLWRRLGLPLATAPEQAVITPACGLAGLSPAQARAALTRCREAASMLAELIEETGGES